MMRCRLAAAIVGVSLLAVAAHAQSWRPIARKCASEINAKAGCGSCGGLWWAWAECTVRRVYGAAVPQARLNTCLDQIYAERARSSACNACGDPVADVMSCVGGGR